MLEREILARIIRKSNILQLTLYCLILPKTSAVKDEILLAGVESPDRGQHLFLKKSSQKSTGTITYWNVPEKWKMPGVHLVDDVVNVH